MADLIQALDALDRLVALAGPVAREDDLARAAEVAARARRRRSLLGETVVVALAGGTGSGKSSLLNAIAGEEVATTGAQRPVTSEPLAWIPSNPEPGLVRLLDAIGIDERVGHEQDRKLALIDLPDTDSFEFSHRELVNRLLPQIDAVVWVVDPEKYHDRILHEDHIAPLAEHGSRFIFALNQIDRIGAAELAAVSADLRDGLVRDGIVEPVVVAIAADPPVGPPLGIDALFSAIERLGDAKSIVRTKLVTDIRQAAASLAEAAGISTPGGTGFAGRWSGALDRSGELVAGSVLAVGRRDMEAHGAVAGRTAVSVWPRRVPAPPVPRVEVKGLVPAATAIHDALAETGAAAGDDARKKLRALDVDGEVAAAVETVVSGFTLESVPLPEWLPLLAWVRRVGAALVMVGLAMAFDRDVYTGPVLLAVAGLALIVGVAAYAAARGRTAAGDVADRMRADLAKKVARELDRRIGAGARAVLRGRAEASAALTDFELVMQALD